MWELAEATLLCYLRCIVMWELAEATLICSVRCIVRWELAEGNINMLCTLHSYVGTG